MGAIGESGNILEKLGKIGQVQYISSTNMHQLLNALIVGTHDCRMDDRGRLRLPAPIVSRNDFEQKGAKFMLSLGMGGHLVLYPADVFEATSQRVLKLDDFDEEQSQFKDMFFQMLDTVDLDGNGRFQISSHLASAVGIDRDVVISGRGDRYYIWAKDVFEKQKPSGSQLRESAQKAFASYKLQTTSTPANDGAVQAA